MHFVFNCSFLLLLDKKFIKRNAICNQLYFKTLIEIKKVLQAS